MRCIQIITSIEDESKGPSYSVVRLAEALAARGLRSGMMSLAESPGCQEINGVEDERFAAVPGLLKTHLSPSRDLARALEMAAADGALMHVHGLWRMPNVYPGRIAARTGAPLVLSPRGMLAAPAFEFSARQKKLFWALFQRRAVRAVTCFHATAMSEVEDIRAFGLDAPVAVIPNGIDIADAAPRADQDSPATRELLSLGRVHPKKGIDRLLRAWALLGEARAGWTLRIVGPSEAGHGEELQTLAHDLGLTNVTFEGPLHGLAKVAAFARAELFVLPTRNENFGMVVAEALAQGTPVISTVGAPWEGLVRESCGWWVDHGPEPLAAALTEAMALTDADRREMGARGRNWMRRDFSWAAIGDKMNRLYHWCSGKGERPEFVVT